MGNSHKNLFLRNHWANCNQTLVEWSLDSRLPKMCPVIPTSNQWFQTRRFLWEFPIGSYVKLSSAVAAILVGGLKCRTQVWKGTTQRSFQQSVVGPWIAPFQIGVRWSRLSTKMAAKLEIEKRGMKFKKKCSPLNFWKRTIQWLFHQNLVLIEQMVSDKKIFMGISHRVLC
jgi:hypothetical protein